MDFDWLIFHEGHNVVNSSFSGLWFILFVSFLSLLMMLLSSSIGQRARRNRDSKIAFECGFDPMSNPRMPFSLPYFLVALLFLVFDVEVVLLLSACYSLKVVFIMLSPVSAMLGIIFCLILFVGLVHEFNEGSLEWRF